jgi:beta-glucosidase
MIYQGRVPMSRIDDAVRRILNVKFDLDLFDNPYPDVSHLPRLGNGQHRKVARQAVRESMVLLQNRNHALPIPKDTSDIIITGPGANDIGLQCGGWTISWQGSSGNTVPGDTLLRSVQKSVSAKSNVFFADSEKEIDRFYRRKNHKASFGVVVVAEKPYAEGNLFWPAFDHC